MKNKIIFIKNLDIRGTCLKDYLQYSYSFTEALARLFTIAKYNIFDCNRKDSTFEVRGKFNGQIFTLYDRADNMIHIGGVVDLNVKLLQIELLRLMNTLDFLDSRKSTELIPCWKFWGYFFPVFNI